MLHAAVARRLAKRAEARYVKETKKTIATLIQNRVDGGEFTAIITGNDLKELIWLPGWLKEFGYDVKEDEYSLEVSWK